MGIPVVVTASGGLPVTEAANGLPVSIASNGFGMPVTLVASGGLPVTGTYTIPSGVGQYVGANNATWQTWLGVTTNMLVTFVDRTSWAIMVSSSVTVAADALASGKDNNFAVPLVANGGTFAEVINGTRDSVFTTIAQNLLTAGIAGHSIVIALGWELNQSVWSWYAGGGNEANYIAAFQRVVGLFKAVSPRFVFDLNTNYAQSGAVDYATIQDTLKPLIAIRSYDFYFTPGDNTDNLGASNWGYNRDLAVYGAAAVKDWAVANGKLFNVREIGIPDSYNGFSLVGLISGALQWFKLYVNSMGWWEGDHGGVSMRLANGNNPLAAAEFKDNFGAPYAYANAEAAAYAARMTSAPFGWRKALIDVFTGSVKSGALSGANVYSKLAEIFILAAQDSQAALLHFKTNASSTLVNNPAFVADRGFTGKYDGSFPEYISTGRTLSSFSGLGYTQNSASAGTWELTNLADNVSSIGVSDGVMSISSRRSGDTYGNSINDFTSPTSATSTDGRGFFGANRSGASARQWYKNGLQIKTDTPASNGPSNNTVLLMAGQPAFPRATQHSFAFLGGTLTANEWKDLYNAIRLYLITVGAILAADYAIAT
ncbi:MAG: hypothetical protein ABWZ74_06795 [Hyphomicrobiaceae bacterium]